MKQFDSTINKKKSSKKKIGKCPIEQKCRFLEFLLNNKLMNQMRTINFYFDTLTCMNAFQMTFVKLDLVHCG